MQILEMLKTEITQTENRLEALRSAVAALNGGGVHGERKRWRLSPSARRRISLAQKARWAKQKASAALNGRLQVRQKPARHRKGWSAAARKAQSQKLKAIWARKRKGQKWI